MDLENLKIKNVRLSEDKTKLFLEIPGLKKGHVIYFSLPEDIHSVSGQSLWSSEAGIP